MNKIILGVGALALIVGGAVLLSNPVAAFQGDPNTKGPNYSAERHAAMTKAFETQDYEAWKSLMAGKGRVLQVINKDNFSKFAEAHQLAAQGQTVAAQKIRQELGLGKHAGVGSHGQGKNNRQGGNCGGRNR